MKLHVLAIAIALATGSAFAAGSYDTQPAAPSRAGEAMHKAGDAARKAGSEVKAEAHKLGSETKHAVKKHEKHHAAKKADKEHHAAARHHGTRHASARHHEKHASAKHHEAKHAAAKHHAQHMASRSDTRMMGGAAAPVTDLNAAARQRRIDDAYAHWRALPR